MRRASQGSSSLRAACAAGLLVAVLVLNRTASATDGEGRSGGTVRFHLTYAADDGCPTEGDFRHGVEARALRAQATDAAHASVGLAVTLRRDGERTAGVLVVTLPDGTSSERRISDTSCEAAAASLALVSALGLDALLSAARAPSDEPAKPPEASASAAPTPAPAASAPMRLEPTRPVAAPQPQRRVDFQVRAHGFWENAAAPQAPFGVLAGGAVTSRSTGFFAPSAGLVALMTLSGRATSTAGSADFRLVAARLTGCPLRLGRPAGPSLRPCLDLDAGALRGTPAGSAPRIAAALGLAAGVTSAGLPALAVSGGATGALLSGSSHLGVLGIMKWLGAGILVGTVASGGAAIVYRGAPSSKLPSPTANAAARVVPAHQARTEPAAPTTYAPGPEVTVQTLPAAPREPGVTQRGPADEPAVATLPAEASALAHEVALIDQARVALRSGDARAALTALARYDEERQTRVLDREAAVLRIEALRLAGRQSEAREQAKRYLDRYPVDAHSAGLRELVRAGQSPEGIDP